jgi:hypothetical protein
MRCTSCNKFVPYDAEVEPEEQDAPTADGGTFTASYRRVLNCEECGEELKEATIEFDYDFSGDEPEVKGKSSEEGHEHEREISCDVQPTTGSQTTDRRGRKITNPRYMKTLYGVCLDVTLTCECGQTMKFDLEESCSASSMDELT